jgi:membrane-associated protease RseP (regulator of RpoE activity)
MTSNIYIYDISFLVLFSLAVIIFLYKNRKNLKKEGIMYLYKTNIGIKLIDKIGVKYKKAISVFSFLAIISGYILMSSMVYFLYKLLYIYLFRPEIVQSIKIPPLLPLIPYVPELFKVSFLPPFYFTYWIIAIAVIAVFHEFAHGIVARRYGIKIKTTGFGFLGPFLAAFVEPDEKEMEKKPKYQQMAVLSAGTFTNLILSILFFLLLFVFFNFSYAPAGAIFNTYTPEIINISEIRMIGDLKVYGLDSKELNNIIISNNMGDDVILTNNGNSLNLTRIRTNNRSYYVTIGNLKEQLKENLPILILYKDLPAINLVMEGVIVEFDGKNILTYDDLAIVLKEHNPGDKVNIKTKYENKILDYNIILAEDSNQKGRAVIGIGYMKNQATGLMSKIFDFLNFFKKTATAYEPVFNVDLVIFIYNLLWWLALINLSVALINMWPVAIFDGGRMFFLTIWAITGSEKFAQVVFRILTYIILGALLLLMVGWAWAIF